MEIKKETFDIDVKFSFSQKSWEQLSEAEKQKIFDTMSDEFAKLAVTLNRASITNKLFIEGLIRIK